MAFAGPLLGSIGLGALGSALFNTPGKPPSPLKSVTRDDARAAIAADDELRKRRGAASDILFGAEGAGTPAVTGKLVLGA